MNTWKYTWEYKQQWQRAYRAHNPEKVREQYRQSAQKRRENHKEEHAEYRRKEYLKRSEYYKEKSRIWRLTHRSQFLDQMKKASERRRQYITQFKGKVKCLWCECILKDHESHVCTWCIKTYPHKYAILNMKALHTYVIFKPIEEKEAKKSAVILLTEKEAPKKYRATVTSVGKECKVLKVGDTILTPRYADEFDIKGEHYMVCKEEDICAIL